MKVKKRTNKHNFGSILLMFLCSVKNSIGIKRYIEKNIWFPIINVVVNNTNKKNRTLIFHNKKVLKLYKVVRLTKG